MVTTRTYKYRLYPTPVQESILVQWAGCRRWVWNWALGRKRDHYKTTGKGLTYNALAAELTQLKHDKKKVWLKACHSQVLQQSLMDVETAFSNFFEKRAKYPKFKSRKTTLPSLRFPQHVQVLDEYTVRIPKLGDVRAVVHRPLEGTSKGATIKQTATGHWYVCIVCHHDQPDFVPMCTNPVGIDMGLETFVTLSTGEKIAPPKYYRRGDKKLRKAQRVLSRKQKGSANRAKARKRVARIHETIKNQRNDFLHKHSIQLIRNFDTVCIEDLNVKGLVRTKLAKSFSDAAVRTFIEMLTYKGQWYGSQVVKVGRFYASSKTCHRCQSRTELTLSQRIWTCSHCGTHHDRDVNAAMNILNEGVRFVTSGTQETQNASGDGVNPAKRW